VSVHTARGVVAIEHGAELAAVVSRRVGDPLGAQNVKGAVNADVMGWTAPAIRHRGDLDQRPQKERAVHDPNFGNYLLHSLAVAAALALLSGVAFTNLSSPT
jgi:hypothetical protein